VLRGHSRFGDATAADEIYGTSSMLSTEEKGVAGNPISSDQPSRSSSKKYAALHKYRLRTHEKTDHFHCGPGDILLIGAAGIGPLTSSGYKAFRKR